jgi:hypothetical protein
MDLLGVPQTASMDVTYTYRGVRQQDGREVAVLSLSGNLVSARDPSAVLRGRTTGTAVVDPDTGLVIQATATADATLVVRYRGDTFQARGTLEVNLSRTPDLTARRDPKPDAKPDPKPDPKPEVEVKAPVPDAHLPASAFGIKPPKLDKDTEVMLPSTVEEVCVGGGGRYIIMSMPRDQKLAIFDVNEAKVVKYLAVPEGTAKFAATGDKLFVILPSQNLAQRYSLKTFERDMTVQIGGTNQVNLALAGSASRGPLLIGRAGAGPGRGSEMVFLDTNTLKPLYIRLNGSPFDSTWRMSADGRVLTMFNPGLSPQGHTIFTRAGAEYRPHTVSENNFAGHIVPGADGRFVYTARGILSPEGKPVGKMGSYSDGSRYSLPAAEGEAFYLRIDVPDFPHGIDRGRGRGNGKLYVHLAGEERPIAELDQVELPKGLNTWGREKFGVDRRFFLIPSAKLLVYLPESQDRLRLYRVDVDELLNKADYDYLVVLSRPPAEAVRGKSFTYTPAVKSKKGGVKLKVESGPPGMKVTADGKLTWDVPGTFRENEVQVLLLVSDAGGKETFHSFKLAVVNKGSEP